MAINQLFLRLNDLRASSEDEAVLSSLVSAQDVDRLTHFLSKSPRVSEKHWKNVWRSVLLKSDSSEDMRSTKVFDLLRAHPALVRCTKEETLPLAIQSLSLSKVSTLAKERSWTKELLSNALLDAVNLGMKHQVHTNRFITPEERLVFSKSAIEILRECGADLHTPIERGDWEPTFKFSAWFKHGVGSDRRRASTTVWSLYVEAKPHFGADVAAFLESWNDHNQLSKVLTQETAVEAKKTTRPAL